MKTKLILFICSLALLSACKESDSNPKIGVLLPLTGKSAVFGESAKNGIDVALKELTAKGIHYNVTFEDTKAQAKTAVSATNKLIATNHKVLIGPLSSAEALSIAPITERKRILTLSPGASSPKLSEYKPYTFRNVPSDIYEAGLMASFSYDSLNMRSIAILYINTEYGVGVKKAFTEKFTSLGGEVHEESYSNTATDFKTQLTKLKSYNCEALYLVGYQELGILIKQAKELNMPGQFLTTAIFEDEAILRTSNRGAEGIIFTSITFDAENPNQRAVKFKNAYNTLYSKMPDGYAAVAYDAVYILHQAYLIHKNQNIPLNKAMLQIKDFDGLLGTINFDENGDVLLPIKLKKIRNNRITNY